MTLLLETPETTTTKPVEVGAILSAHQDLHGRLVAQIDLELTRAQYVSVLAGPQHLLTFMETEVIKECRRSQDGTFHLQAHHLHFYHGMLEIIMRDDAMPVPGSAHALLNEWLDVAPGMTLIHTKGGESEVRDCVVKIVLLQHAG